MANGDCGQALKEFKPARAVYPWDVWASGAPRRVRRGKHFTCSIPGFRSTLYNHALRNQMKVRVATKGDVIEFQFVPTVRRYRRHK